MKNKKFLIIAIAIITLVAVLAACGNEKTTPSDNPTAKTEGKGLLIYDDTAAFDYYEVEGGIAISDFINYDYVEYDKIIVPSEIDGYTVVGIGWTDDECPAIAAVFGNCEIVLPDTVEFIGANAFQGAKGLVKLSGAANCKTICSKAFIHCENLKEITFLDNVTDIADDAFLGCTAWEATH